MTIIVAMALTIIPWATPTLNLMPDWVLLVLIYWSLATPEAAGVGKAWFVGLLVDVLTGQLLGQYALAYAASIYLSIKQHKRIRHNPIIQQSLFVCLILLVAQIIIFWLERINGLAMPPQFWLPVLTGGLIWPLIIMLMRNLRFYSY
ncbi:rod shape-determining protein MreD [Methyloprofundus sp.]|uniref:rod shape-determining protein MreD n=1 Tax=Methyloprofundus sp. TaxID=2020875 RepID=UPI003D13DA36